MSVSTYLEVEIFWRDLRIARWVWIHELAILIYQPYLKSTIEALTTNEVLEPSQILVYHL